MDSSIPIITTYKFGCYWYLVYWHDVRTGDYWKKEEVPHFYNINRLSVLGNINPKFKIHNKYEFLLYYPELNGYNRWRQTRSPIDEPYKTCEGIVDQIHSESICQVEGYENIDCMYTKSLWGGLGLSYEGNDLSFIDGCIGHEDRFFAIGTYTAWAHGNIPVQEYTSASQVSLWVRIPVLQHTKTFCYKSHFFHLILIIIIIK